MKMNFLTFGVRDLERSIEFYKEAAGLHVSLRFPISGGEIAFMAESDFDPMIELICAEGVPKYGGDGMILCFLADRPLEEIRQKVFGLGLKPTEIDSAGPQPVNFKVLDPDGIPVEFAEPRPI